jgi:hypothetical protein
VYDGRNVYPITGLSLLPTLQGNATDPSRTTFSEELYGRTYVYSDNWKAVWIEPPFGPADGEWTLYDIRADRGETNNLAAQRPDVLSDLKSAERLRRARGRGAAQGAGHDLLTGTVDMVVNVLRNRDLAHAAGGSWAGIRGGCIASLGVHAVPGAAMPGRRYARLGSDAPPTQGLPAGWGKSRTAGMARVTAGVRTGTTLGYPDERPAENARRQLLDRSYRGDGGPVRSVRAGHRLRHRCRATRRGGGLHKPTDAELGQRPYAWWTMVTGANWRHPEGPAAANSHGYDHRRDNQPVTL